ncbi:hypothetical protein MHYP_G00033790 [Metynnis hypsauchen]
MPAGWEKPREKLYNSTGRELRRALFSLKQIFQDDKDLVHEFVVAEGLTCLIKVGAEADQNYQNYILRVIESTQELRVREAKALTGGREEVEITALVCSHWGNMSWEGAALLRSRPDDGHQLSSQLGRTQEVIWT